MLFVCHPQILHKHCLQFLLGVKMAPRETKKKAYAKCCGDKQRALWYVMVFSGVVNCGTLQSQRSFNSRITCHSLNLDLRFTRVFIHKSTTESSSVQTNVLIMYVEIKLSYNKRPHDNKKYKTWTNSLQTLSKKAVDASNRKLQTGSHRPASACALSAISWFSSSRHFARLPSVTFIGVCANSQRVTKYMISPRFRL